MINFKNNLFSGIASVFNLFGNTYKLQEQSDRKVIKTDFEQVGKDIKKMLEKEIENNIKKIPKRRWQKG